MLICLTTTIFLCKEWPLFLLLYFRRSYKGTLPFLVTSSYLVRKFNFNDCHYDKNCVLHIMLTFAMTHIFLYEIWPCFNLLFSQIAHSYITCSSKTINSSPQVTLLVGILINELCSACNAYFWNNPHFLIWKLAPVLISCLLQIIWSYIT